MTNKKGITPVVAVVLLLMMTVAAAAGAYFWMNSITSSLQSQFGSRVTDIFGSVEIHTVLMTCNATTNTMSPLIINDGPGNIPSGAWIAILSDQTGSQLSYNRTDNVPQINANDLLSFTFDWDHGTPAVSLLNSTRYSISVENIATNAKTSYTCIPSGANS
ncbi:MAG: hypothetical protein PHW96_03615 [Candidatus Nanoarchaeia archaeon]|nr:hypothetical protein [Candidatus Nanoarchaeia archaeon]